MREMEGEGIFGNAPSRDLLQTNSTQFYFNQRQKKKKFQFTLEPLEAVQGSWDWSPGGA